MHAMKCTWFYSQIVYAVYVCGVCLLAVWRVRESSVCPDWSTETSTEPQDKDLLVGFPQWLQTHIPVQSLCDVSASFTVLPQSFCHLLQLEPPPAPLQRTGCGGCSQHRCYAAWSPPIVASQQENHAGIPPLLHHLPHHPPLLHRPSQDLFLCLSYSQPVCSRQIYRLPSFLHCAAAGPRTALRHWPAPSPSCCVSTSSSGFGTRSWPAERWQNKMRWSCWKQGEKMSEQIHIHTVCYCRENRHNSKRRQYVLTFFSSEGSFLWDSLKFQHFPHLVKVVLIRFRRPHLEKPAEF